jgi:hypothetical protein
MTDPIPPTDTLPPDASAVARLWRVFHREPMLLVTCSYLFVSIVGLWDSYWFYRRFDLPILEYMQAGDYFVAGLRRPVYLVLLVVTMLFSTLTLWPERWRQRNPERGDRLQARWWGRLLVPKRSDWWAYFGLHPETMVTLVALFTMGAALFVHSNDRATAIQRGEVNGVAVELARSNVPLPGKWSTLGTSSAFVFLWNRDEERALVVPIEGVGSLLPVSPTPAGASAPTAADDGADPGTVP